MVEKHNRSIFPLILLMLFDHTSLNITFPILTLLFFDLQSHLFPPDTSHAVRSLWYGACISIPYLINLIATPILSALSDSLGRRKILLLGTFGAFLFALTCAFGVLFGLLSLFFLGRIIQGAFSRTNPVAQAVIGDISPPDKKVVYMGYLQSAISIGAFMGPILGGYFANRYWFATLNFSFPYFLAALLAGISFLLTCFIFKETLPTPKQTRWYEAFSLSNLKRALYNRDVIYISCVLLLSQISWSIYYHFIPPILKTELQFSVTEVGLFVGCIAFWLAIATLFAIRWLEYFFTFRQMILVAFYSMLVGLVLTAIALFYTQGGQHSWVIWLGAIPTAMGDVVAYTCLTTLYSDVVPKEDQGKIMGLCFTVIALIWACTGALGGVLMSFYSILPILFAPIGVLGGILLLHRSKGLLP